MPRPTLPPTPASSTDITGKDHTEMASLELSFTLPPPALAAATSSGSSKSPSGASDASYRPVSPTSPVRTSVDPRSRSSKGRLTSDREEFALPPPPTRSRKIIQMKPRPQDNNIAPERQAAAKGASKAPSSPATTGKKKQPSATSAAGRKTARKTAHSLIERRRRSKMNEEFGVLKDMIPACKDQEMHKLAILQASIEYLRYLEQCVTELKANAANAADSYSPSVHPRTSASQHASSISPPADDDVEMSEASEKTPSTASPHYRFYEYQQFSESNVVHEQQTQPQSTLPSPAFEPQQYSYPVSHASSLSASPALNPQKENTTDLDHEATAALLMLNSDRRSHGARGMSVKDLLSS